MMDMLALTPDESRALWLSVKVACWCVLLSLLPAIGLAWLMARVSFWGKSIVQALILLPMVLPPVVPGYLLLLFFGQQGLGGQLLAQIGIVLPFHWTGAVVASMVMSVPLFVQPIRLAMQGIDRRTEQAARLLGAGPWRVFLSMTLPLSAAGILTGAVLAFGRSLGEFGATISFVGNIDGQTRTLPLAIYSAIQQPNGEHMAMRLVVLSMLLAFAALWISHLISQRQQRRLGLSDV
jgi:molybdate transport system permease protein